MIQIETVGLFVATWGWIATLTYKVGKMNGDIKDKVDLMFAKMFKDSNNGEITELKKSVRELEKKINN